MIRFLRLTSVIRGKFELSQGSVATRSRCGGIFNYHCAANLPLSMSVKNFENRLRNDRVTAMSLVSPFFWNTVYTNVHCISEMHTYVACPRPFCQNNACWDNIYNATRTKANSSKFTHVFMLVVYATQRNWKSVV